MGNAHTDTAALHKEWDDETKIFDIGNSRGWDQCLNQFCAWQRRRYLWGENLLGLQYDDDDDDDDNEGEEDEVDAVDEPCIAASSLFIDAHPMMAFGTWDHFLGVIWMPILVGQGVPCAMT
ncbi:hypothetical protein ACJX0J_040316, partial [Zea mays]